MSEYIDIPANDPILGTGPDETGLCGISRRQFVHGSMAAAVGSLACTWSDLLAGEKLPQLDNARADQVIVMWMGGGPTQMETWDPKPENANGGELGAVATSVDGIQIGSTLPKIAKEFKDVSVIRSMATGEGNHGRGTYLMHTGYTPTGTVKHPGVGSIISNETINHQPPGFDLPSFISVRTPSQGAGFLGVDHEPLVVSDPRNPIANMRYNYSKDRFFQRVKLLDRLEKRFAASKGKEEAAAHDKIYKRTIRLIHSKRTKEAFDITREPQSVLDDYGKVMVDGVEMANGFGTSALMARKLLEAGVRFVEISLGGWDMHGQVAMNATRNNTMLDGAFSALVKDLRSRGMLERTLIVWMGEFGRTPRLNNNAGRDHWARSWSIAMAGGGINGGMAIGKTSKDGMDVENDPHTSPDVLATIYKSLGIDTKKVNYSSRGRPIPLVRGGSPIDELVV